ncbi:hypothetical protein PIB30_027392 [Stylosanthes scabra]|uniref:Uncharacterized protein n=1 Tax=Stylosanthes scabra TaxID=79078 RepID=A0ABU6UDX2_9FABA|nr:hypothetical protein [Stylosanthes scabra]
MDTQGEVVSQQPVNQREDKIGDEVYQRLDHTGVLTRLNGISIGEVVSGGDLHGLRSTFGDSPTHHCMNPNRHPWRLSRRKLLAPCSGSFSTSGYHAETCDDDQLGYGQEQPSRGNGDDASLLQLTTTTRPGLGAMDGGQTVAAMKDNQGRATATMRPRARKRCWLLMGKGLGFMGNGSDWGSATKSEPWRV